MNQISVSETQKYSGLGFIKVLIVLSMIKISLGLNILLVDNDKNNSDHFRNQAQLLEVMQSFGSDIEWHKCNFSAIFECIEIYPNTSILFDLSDSSDIQSSLSQVCKEYKKIHLVFEQVYNPQYYDGFIQSIIPSYSDQMDAYFAALSYFNWTKGLIIMSENNYFDKQRFLDFSAAFNYLIIEPSTNFELLINRIIKPLGVTLYYILTDYNESLKIQQILESKKLLLKGDGIILNQKSGYGCNTDGALIVAAKGQEYAISLEEVLISSTKNMMLFLLNNTIGTETSEDLRIILKKYDEQKEFSIINIQNGKRIIVGSVINEEVTIFKNLIFPGNSDQIPKSQKKILHVTASGGTTNPGGPTLVAASISYLGAYTAWKLINDDTFGILQNFEIQHFIFDCGVYIFNETFMTNCFKKDFDKFGLAHISAPSSSTCIGEMIVFKKLNFTIPLVGATDTDYTLNSTAIYPMFSRVVISNRYIFTLTSLLLKALGWNKMCILYTSDLLGKSGYAAFMPNAERYGLEILNPENMRMIPQDLNRTTVKNYDDVFQSIIDTNARLLVFLIQPPPSCYVLERLYDLGLRKGDLITFTPTPDNLRFIEYDNLYTKKVQELGTPMLTISGQFWVGEMGQLAYSKILSTYKLVPNSYGCYCYDAGYIIGQTLDYMVNHGLDYYDPQQTNLAMRVQKFAGCTGKVAIEKNSNDRIMENFDISSNKINTTSGNFISYVIGEFHPYSSPILIITNSIIYGDGTTNKPDDLRNQNNKCPFPDKQIRTFTNGRILVFGLCFGVAFISVVVTAYIWKKWWNIPVEMLKEKQEISLQDIIVEATIGIEFFQFAAMGPDFTPINGFLADFSSFLSLNLENILKLENGVFWIVIDVVYSAIALWAILCLVILLRLDEKFPSISFLRFLAWLANQLMPILGNLCFIPFISMCLNVFVCDQSIGDNFTDSFLSQDCYYFCWKDEHLIYAILSFIALLCYEPFAVFCRPLWQELQNNLHILAVPLFLMVKTVVQIIFIVMNKTIKRAESTVHGVLYIVIMVAYIVFIFKYKPYNYARVCWWQALSLIGVVWLAILSVISANIQANYIAYFLILCFGWAFILLIGIYVQAKKYPSLLYRKKGLDTSHLFKFAFAFGKQSKLALSKIVPSKSSLKNFSLEKELSNN